MPETLNRPTAATHDRHGTSAEANALLEISCHLAGAQRAGIFRIGHDGTRFDGGYRMSAQLGLALMPQLDMKQPVPVVQSVVLGMETYQCLVIHITGPTLSSRTLLALFEPGRQVTAQTLGRLEGAFHAWWQLHARMADAHKTLHVCSACQHIMMAEGIWLSWEEFMHKQLGLDASHTLCQHCFIELYGTLHAPPDF